MNNYLIDTHVLLWLLFSPEKLPGKTLALLKNRHHTISVSVISFWEISLKFGLDKLTLTNVFPHELPALTTQMDIQIAPITADEFASFHQLPLVESHKDPFDRMIIWQCISKKMIFISHDKKLDTYRQLGLRTP